MHLDLDQAVPLARLAPAALDVEGEAPGLVAAHPGIRRAREQRPDQGENTRVGRRVGARRPPDRRLVDVDDLVEMLGSLDPIVVAGALVGAVEHLRQRAVQDVVDEGGLARARDTRHRREGAERDLDRHALEVVLARVVDGDVLAVGRPARRRDGDLLGAGEEPARERGRVRGDLLRRAQRDQVPAQLPRPRTQVHDEIGCADGFFVVLHHEDRVTEVPQPLQRVEKPAVIPLVKPDAGLVEDVQHANQARADLGREPDPLSLAARQCRRCSIERQIVEPDLGEEAEPLADLLEHTARDLGVPLREGQRVEELPCRLDREPDHVRDGSSRDLDGECLRPEAGALAGGAVSQRHETLEILSHFGRQRLLVAALEDLDGALEAVPGLAVEDDVSRLLPELPPRRREIEFVAAREHGEGLLEGRGAGTGPGGERPIAE